MMHRTHTVGLVGVDGFVITVEADVGLGLPCLTVVGQCSGALAEARERVRSALRHCGHEIPSRRQLVNLAPADRRKDSPGMDFAVACALLSAHEIIDSAALKRTLLWGELGLDGRLRPACGTLSVAHVARDAGFERIVVPHASREEAALIPNIEVVGVRDLASWVRQMRGEPEPAGAQKDAGQLHEPSAVDMGSRPDPHDDDDEYDLSDVRGMERPRLALELMVAGGHNLLYYGPPGVGKTMLARRVRGLFPDLERERALEASKVHSLARGSSTPRDRLIVRPPVRMPHHSVSPAGLLGGGNPPRPGEASKAHGGVLFLDELPEFSRTCIEGLREPIEAGEVQLVRARYAVRFPARFQLLAAMNPCPCGYHGHPQRSCVCSPQSVARYQRKISGPFIDRIDLVVPITPLSPEQLAAREVGESTAVVRERIRRAREIQSRRYADAPWSCNAEVPARGSYMDRYCPLSEQAATLLDAIGRAHNLSARALHRVRRVARSVSDVRVGTHSSSGSAEACERSPIDRSCVALALSLRQLPEL